MRAERERRAAVTNAEASKRAAVLEAEGSRESQVRRAEGEKEAAILRAQGLAEARLAMAQAEAEAIQRVTAALPQGDASMYLLGLKYLEALPAVAQGRGTTLFLPSETSGVLGAMGALRSVLGATGAAGASGASPSGEANGTIAAPAGQRALGSGVPSRYAPPAPDPDAPMRSLLDAMGATPRAPGGDPAPR
jgi:hypothetical protein